MKTVSCICLWVVRKFEKKHHVGRGERENVLDQGRIQPPPRAEVPGHPKRSHKGGIADLRDRAVKQGGVTIQLRLPGKLIGEPPAETKVTGSYHILLLRRRKFTITQHHQSGSRSDCQPPGYQPGIGVFEVERRIPPTAAGQLVRVTSRCLERAA